MMNILFPLGAKMERIISHSTLADEIAHLVRWVENLLGAA
jgi:hypothetical protein